MESGNDILDWIGTCTVGSTSVEDGSEFPSPNVSHTCGPLSLEHPVESQDGWC